jgi:hypothetical protein
MGRMGEERLQRPDDVMGGGEKYTMLFDLKSRGDGKICLYAWIALRVRYCDLLFLRQFIDLE